MNNGILISWIAVRNDPYEKAYPSGEYIRDNQKRRTLGPTLTVLFDANSPLSSAISKVHLLFQSPDNSPEGSHKAIASELEQAIRDKSLKHSFEVNTHPCNINDPTDHEAIASVVIPILERIRNDHPDDILYIHVSPGTPAMHAVWVHLSEAGHVRGKYKLIKSYRKGEHPEDKRVVEIQRGFSGRIQTMVNDSVFLKGDSFNYENCQSALFRDLRERVDRIANLRVPVVVLGERGTGKTTLVKFIRDRSIFKNKKLNDNWPVVACGQLSGTLIQSKLFGYTKGAFTGAEKETSGLLEDIHGDTLFLDEIADLDKDTQRLLIRALEERTYTPLGSDVVKSSDFRLICATNRPVEELQQRLHPDFWDRISYFILHMPPLRDTPEDLELFWDSVYEKAVAKSQACNVYSPGRTQVNNILDKLKGHPLPGNLRDLYRISYEAIARRWWDADNNDPDCGWVVEVLNYGGRMAAVDDGNEAWRRLARGLSGQHKEFQSVFTSLAPIDFDKFIKWVKARCAREAKEYARVSHKPIKEVVECPTAESLRKWQETLE
jgi:predicted ATP-dependent protease